MFGTPVVTLPCREAFLSIMPQVQTYLAELKKESRIHANKAEGAALLVSTTDHTYTSIASIDIECNEKILEDGFDISGEDDNELTLTQKIFHVTSTFAIAFSGFFAAVAVPGEFPI